MRERIESVAVVGGGIVGWSAAAALKRRLPYLGITLILSDSAGEDPANRLISTLPSITGFHEDIGLTEADTVARAASGIRLGTRFSGWVDSLPPYVHSYGTYGRSLSGVPFHQLWLRARGRDEAEAFEAYSCEASLAGFDRVPDPRSGAGPKDLQYGLQIDIELYESMMRAYARHLGVRVASAPYARSRLRPDDGFMAAALLEDGSEVTADLFLDCTGPKAALRSELDDAFEDWGSWLPSDRVLLGGAAPAANLPVVDEVEAIDIGWRWRASSPRGTSFGLVYSSEFATADEAAQRIAQAGGTPDGEGLHLRRGHRQEPWLRNCVALGSAAVAVEPLEWTNLHLVHSAVDRIVTMMPGRDCAPIELFEYNRQCTAEAERVRDFICMHYLTSRRSEPFWEAARQIAPPPSLAHTMELFRDRGRLPFYEEETFARDSWLAVLFGQGVYPRRIDPLVDTIEPAAAASAMSRIREMIATATRVLPDHESYLRNFLQQAVR